MLRQQHSVDGEARIAKHPTVGRRDEPLPLPGNNNETHAVLNQASPLRGYNAFLSDPALKHAVTAHGGDWGFDALEALGAKVGSADWQQIASDANRYPPRLETHDRFGNRRDAAEYHPAYHQLMQLGIEHGVSAFAWRSENEDRPGAHVVRGALMFLMYQLDAGVCCPMTMTFAAVPALRQQKLAQDRCGFASQLIEKLVAGKYNGTDKPLSEKLGATVGMSMTEKQGGTDVRANTTTAKPLVPLENGPGDVFSLVGHKWFTSAPMSDAFLTLAQTEEGVSCFIVPRWMPDGSRNAGFQVQRLKDKLGDKSNASSEVEYREAWGVMLGQAGRGVRTIIEMVVHTRLDCIIGSSALMRLSAQHAARHAASRTVFGRPLFQQPLMRGVLADLALESESAMALWLRLARALERGHAGNVSEAAFARLAVAIAKYYVCKRAPAVACEAMECLGGNGYVEEGPLARLYRQAPLNAIWEGSGNVICLDVVRAVRVEPASTAAVLEELEAAKPLADASEHGYGYTQTLAALRENLALAPEELELRAREVVEKLAVCLQASVLLQSGDMVVADAFLTTRLPSVSSTGGVGVHLATHSLGAMGARLPAAAIEYLLDRLLIREGMENAACGEHRIQGSSRL